MFWKIFAFVFPRNLIIFALLIAWIIGAAWLLSKAFPSAPSLLLLLVSTVGCALLASIGQTFMKIMFKF